MTSIWFVTPAHGRIELTRICLEQRLQVIDALAAHGVSAHQVVIASDANLNTARDLSLDVVVRDNSGVGRKFNDGFAYAGEHGADWIVPIGSDSWIMPEYFLPLPDERFARMANFQAVVTRELVAELDIARGGPYVFPRWLMQSRGFRPAADEAMRGIDRSTLDGLGRDRIEWEAKDITPMQYVGFRGDRYLTSIVRLMRHASATYEDRAERLVAAGYDPELVSRVLKLRLSSLKDEGKRRLGIPGYRTTSGIPNPIHRGKSITGL